MQQAGPGTPGQQPRGRGTQMRWETEGLGWLWGEAPSGLNRGNAGTQSTCHCVEMTPLQLCEVYTADFSVSCVKIIR